MSRAYIPQYWYRCSIETTGSLICIHTISVTSRCATLRLCPLKRWWPTMAPSARTSKIRPLPRHSRSSFRWARYYPQLMWGIYRLPQPLHATGVGEGRSDGEGCDDCRRQWGCSRAGRGAASPAAWSTIVAAFDKTSRWARTDKKFYDMPSPSITAFRCCATWWRTLSTLPSMTRWSNSCPTACCKTIFASHFVGWSKTQST